jgi:diguanylate cyclase (GGDEF)-like protein
MRIHSAETAFIDWLDLSVPDQKFHYELVRALYSTPLSIFIAVGVAATIMAIVTALSGDWIYGLFVTAFLIVGAARAATIALYQRARHDANDVTSVKRWELRALLGAWAFAGLVGGVGAYTVRAHPGSELEILISCCVMGYIAGISSRNASRPVISVGQITLTCIPFTLALIARADIVHLLLAAFVGVLYLSTIVICRSVFDNIVSRQIAFRKIEVIVQRDALTDLWNRAAFLELLERHIAAVKGSRNIIALISIDLDRFKDINDTLGHPVGDTILRDVANRIRSVVRPGDEIARIGGDEFLVMLVTTDVAEADAAARRILAIFSSPFKVNTRQNSCGASIGYAIAPTDGATLETLFRNSDLALYEAKRQGRGQVVRYTEAIAERYDDRMALEQDLQFALRNAELELVYQPVVDPRSGRAICCEALLRWNHPVHGRINPADFIPIAEATGLIVPIGAWVLATACSEATRWPTDIKLSVNLSPVQFRLGHDIVETVLTTLRSVGLPAHRLDLEVTETVLIDDGAGALAVLEKLRANDVGVSLDDFGTGFASLAYLNDFPFSKVKIDRKFSQNIDQSPRTSVIIAGIAKITRDLKIELVAEGIETENQLEHIRSFGIHAVQGFLYSGPLPPHELRRLIGKPILPSLGNVRRIGAAGKEWVRKAVSDVACWVGRVSAAELLQFFYHPGSARNPT